MIDTAWIKTFKTEQYYVFTGTYISNKRIKIGV